MRAMQPRIERACDHATTLVWGESRANRLGRPRVLAVVTALSVLLAAGSFSAHAYATSAIRAKLVASLEHKLGRAARVGDVSLGLSSISLADVEIDGVGRIDRVVAEYSLGALLTGDVEIGRVDAYGLAVELSVNRDRTTSLDDIVARTNSSSDPEPGQQPSRSMLGGVPVAFHDIAVSVLDEATNSRFEFGAAHARPNSADRIVELFGGWLAVSATEDRRLNFLTENPIAEVSGTVALNEHELRVDVSGGFASGANETWAIDFTVDIVSRRVKAHVTTDAVSLARLGYSRLAGGAISGALEIEVDGPAIRVTGASEVDSLTFAHERLSSLSTSSSVSVRGSAEINRHMQSIEISDAIITSAGVPFGVSLEAQLPNTKREVHPEGRFSARIAVSKAPCQSILDAAPAGLLPNISGFELVGEMSAAVELEIDWADLDKTRFTSDLLNPATGIDRCQVKSAPKPMSAARLRGSFEHRAPAGDKWITFVVGEENPNYVPLKRISRNLTRSLMTTEDSRFYRHRGFITKQFRAALIKNLERGRFAYGASSITMQVVKNVMLAREKTISRKLEELFLTWYLERELSKDRILEIYVNAIEFGPGIYGIGRASERFFGKHPSRLNPVESAFFSSILPAPVRRFKQYCRGWAGSATKGKIDRILDHMFERNRLDTDQYIQAVMTPLVFRGNRRAVCRKYEQKGTSL